MPLNSDVNSSLVTRPITDVTELMWHDINISPLYLKNSHKIKFLL
jgi:hypothetical protein